MYFLAHIDYITTVILVFFTYSTIGWMWEMLYVNIKDKTFNNRGFLTGPYIPIYGFGGTIIYGLFNNLNIDSICLFFVGSIFATILEYITAVIMENIFKVKLWTYDNFKFNYKGRICLSASILWGFASIIIVKYFTPFIILFINGINRDLKLMLASSFTSIFVLDILKTCISMFDLKNKMRSILEFENKLGPLIDKIQDINFPEINLEYIKEAYSINSKTIKRITKAFPNMKFRTNTEQNIFDKIKKYNIKQKK